jgi:hypothetical protein
MMRTLGGLVLGAAIATAGLLSAEPQDTKKADKPQIKGGIEGKLKKVDTEKETVIITVDSKDRTFTITDDTVIVGPRGGLVRRRLKDPRFHPGLDVIVVPEGNKVKELHLGYDRKDADETAGQPKSSTKGATKQPAERGNVVPAETPRKTAAKTPTKAATKSGAAKQEEDDEDKEFPGKVKSVDPTKRLLVVTLLNGKDRPFLLSKEVKILVKGTASKQGLRDPMLKAGIPVSVITDAGGRKVKEVKVAPAPARGKKAG